MAARDARDAATAAQQQDRAPLSRDSHVALYVQIADRLEREIAGGVYAPGGRLPSEQTLVNRFAVSRVTVRLAIGHLLNKGLVVRKQGKGTYVAPAHVRHELRDLKGIYDALVAQGLEPETTLLEFGPGTPPPEVADALASGAARRMLLKRLYSLDGAPIALAVTWLPAAAERITWAEAETHPSYAILQILLGIPVARASIAIRGGRAGRDYARTLQLNARSPVLVLQRVSYGPDDTPLEHTRFIVNSERYEFTFTAEGPLPFSSGLKLVGDR